MREIIAIPIESDCTRDVDVESGAVVASSSINDLCLCFLRMAQDLTRIGQFLLLVGVVHDSCGHAAQCCQGEPLPVVQ